jgi:hypothetical protein
VDWLVANKEWLFSGALVALPLAAIGWMFGKSAIHLQQKQRGGHGSVNIQAGGTVNLGASRANDNTSGDNSTNVQAGGAVTIHQGLAYADVRQIALDVFKGKFLQLSDGAVEVAKRRAEEITEAFLRQLQKQNPAGVDHAKEPDFQHALFIVQKQYARYGDKELGDLLVDLLVDRTKQESRSILQIVLNESLAVAPKLTPDQLAALSTVFLFRYTVNNGIGNQNAFYTYLDKYAQPFVTLINKKASCYQHLEYSGCGTVGIGSISLEEIVRRNYPGLFSRGFEEAHFQAKQMTIPFTHPMILPCLNDPNRKQVNALNEHVLKVEAARISVPTDDVTKLIALQNEHVLNDEEVRKTIIMARPYMERVFNVWKDNMSHFTLTSVGIVIGHANIKKSAGEFTDVSTWIN